jgi:hypothetical protein
LSKQFTIGKPRPFEVTEPSILEKGDKEQMPDAKQLTKRQLVVIEDLFRGELDEQEILDKHNVSRNLYNEWQSDDNFIEQFDRRIASAYRQSAILIARYAPLAAAKLIQLTESEKAETARKACLDIIQSDPRHGTQDSKTKAQNSGSQSEVCGLESVSITEQTAGRLLAALAEEKKD